jgi:aspartyl-tRNA(Asn)/glutamyl-tRNA(Gln) amidotransferase subunit C
MDSSTVARLAELAELDLDPAEREAIAADLQRILHHMEEIAALPLDPDGEVEAAPRTSGSLREDAPAFGLAREAALAAAPRAEDGAFLVPGFVDSL